MGYTARSEVHPRTWDSIQVPMNRMTMGGGGNVQYDCGCYSHPIRPWESFHLCSYHDGFDDGAHAASPTKED